MTSLPAVTQFLLAPFPALLAAVGYTAMRWIQSGANRSHDYHVLGWEVLPLVGIAGGLFAVAIGRGVNGKRSDKVLTATILIVVATLVTAYARAASLTA